MREFRKFRLQTRSVPSSFVFLIMCLNRTGVYLHYGVLLSHFNFAYGIVPLMNVLSLIKLSAVLSEKN